LKAHPNVVGISGKNSWGVKLLTKLNLKIDMSNEPEMLSSVHNREGKKVPQTPQTLSYFCELISIITDGNFFNSNNKNFTNPRLAWNSYVQIFFRSMNNFSFVLCVLSTYMHESEFEKASYFSSWQTNPKITKNTRVD
jgi:hypothetical protein